jgi:hypothetical protein
MKRFLIIFFILIMGSVVFADDQQDALNFFKSFINASNNYSSSLLNMYSSNAKIIRQVVKPDGQLVNVYFSAADYKKQMRISEKLAKLKNYRNCYTDINATKVSNGYKIEAMRRPCNEKYKLKTYMIVQKQSDNNWIIVEELMQTKEQILLKYAR